MKTLLILGVLILIDIIFNWWVIVKKNKKPNHPLNWCARAVAGVVLGYNSEILLWLRNVVSYVPIYWFIFDYGLNGFRHEPLTYLGDAKIDKIEKETLGGKDFWFILKLMLCIFCILSIAFDYNPYSAW